MAAADVGEDVLEWSVICAFGRLEPDDDDVYEEWREGDDVADAGDEGRNTAKNRDFTTEIGNWKFNTHLYLDWN